MTKLDQESIRKSKGANILYLQCIGAILCLNSEFSKKLSFQHLFSSILQPSHRAAKAAAWIRLPLRIPFDNSRAVFVQATPVTLAAHRLESTLRFFGQPAPLHLYTYRRARLQLHRLQTLPEQTGCSFSPLF